MSHPACPVVNAKLLLLGFESYPRSPSSHFMLIRAFGPNINKKEEDTEHSSANVLVKFRLFIWAVLCLWIVPLDIGMVMGVYS